MELILVAPHGDHHEWIDPNNNMRMVIADDGGAISNDGGENWSRFGSI